MTDFSVKIKNLPNINNYINLKALEAELTQHLESVINSTKHTLTSLSPTDAHDEVVNMHFAQKNFINYKILMQIDAFANEGQRYRVKQSHLKDPDEIKEIE